ncbi:T9SS type A sorting domain-containing protein [Mesonia sp. K4-1]|uniref:T9SS type A sorting domain-containing protein n=1 Tax=Mesonia sp. K4-1 TaxID=2602760 RepID=UPI0011C7DD4B|nr:T9SS type A sorting domain-containing protein [Mesonia sp. K4-1]TXK75494.1 T9SS type A sorting domain-containing protein [Mesonia sp. K4-1]TXK75581.1 T9SS type A sorting domain-containing protein [Mesonia sp. K4-1]
MKKNYFHFISMIICMIFCSFTSLSLAQNGPGGVGSDTDNPFWFIANTLSSTTANNTTVSVFPNVGGNTLNATQSISNRRPTFLTNQLNGFPVLSFDGNDYLEIADNNVINQGGPYSDRTLVMAVRTGANVTNRQVIYEEGGSIRGLNIYIDGGSLYVGAYNLNDDDSDTAWGFTSASTTITANTNYIISFKFSGNSSNTGVIETYLNGISFGNLTGIGRLFNHNEAILGAQVNDTYYHTGSVSGDGSYFTGRIAEFIFYSKSLNNPELYSVENYLSSKYNISLGANDVYPYDAPAENDFDFHFIGIGKQNATQQHITSSEGTGILRVAQNTSLSNNEFLAIAADEFNYTALETPSYGCSNSNKSMYRLTSNWRATKFGAFSTVDFSLLIDDFNENVGDNSEVVMFVSNNISFTGATEINATSISGGIATFSNVSIANGDFLSFGIAQSNPNTVLPGGVSTSLNTRFWYQAEDLNLASNDKVSSWINQGQNGLAIEQTTGNRQPLFLENQMNGFPAVQFDGNNDQLIIPNNAELNTSEPYSNRTFSMVFNSGSNITNTQMLYEEGGNTRNLQFFIKDGELHFGGFNNANDGAGSPWTYTSYSTPIVSNTNYVLSYVYDGNSSTTGSIRCYLNGVLAGTISNIGFLYAHTGDITLGGHTDNITVDGSNSTGDYFEGSIAEFLIHDLSLNTVQVRVLHNYYASKYNLNLSNNDLFAFDSAVGGDFDHNLVGIYRTTAENKNVSQIGTGIINITNPSSLDTNEHLLIAANRQGSPILDAADIDCSTTGIDNQKLATIWRVDEGGDVGTVDLDFLIDQISLSSAYYNSIELIIADNPSFTTPTVVSGTINCSNMSFSGINLDDGDYFTLRYKDVQPITWDGTNYANGSGIDGAPNNNDQGRKLVVLNAGAAITENASVGCIHIASGAGASFDAGIEFSIQGDIYNLGSIDGSEASFRLNGNTTQTFSNNGFSMGEFELNNPSGVTIALATDEFLFIDEVLRINQGILTTGGQVYLRCDFTNGPAQIDRVQGTISGDITTEQCFPAKRAFRLITSSVDSGESIHANWQEAATSYTNNPNSGYGTHITGVDTSSDQTNGFDYTPSGNPSMYTYDNGLSQWQKINNTDNTNLVAGVPYRLLVRGDRSIDVTSNSAFPTNTRLRNKGNVLSGDVIQTNFNSTDGAANFFGNPYHAAVDMDLIMTNAATNNVAPNFYYVYDPDLGGSPTPGTPGGRGGYVTIDLSDGSNNNASSDANQYLQPMQAAFFLTGNAGTTPSLAFTEANKAVDVASNQVFRPTLAMGKEINIQLFTQEAFTNNKTSSDGLRIKFSAQANNAIDAQDAPKFFNLDENLARIDQGNYITIENRALPYEGEVLPLFTYQYRYQDYVLQVDLTDAFNYEVYLEDAYLQTSTLLSTGTQYVNFQVDASIPASIATDRFSLSFGKSLNINSNTAQGIQVYPNPVTGNQVYLQLPQHHGNRIELKVYNVLGQQIFEKIVSPNAEKTLQINSIPFSASGMYFLKMIDLENNHTYEIKLIKS